RVEDGFARPPRARAAPDRARPGDLRARPRAAAARHPARRAGAHRAHGGAHRPPGRPGARGPRPAHRDGAAAQGGSLSAGALRRDVPPAVASPERLRFVGTAGADFAGPELEFDRKTEAPGAVAEDEPARVAEVVQPGPAVLRE